MEEKSIIVDVFEYELYSYVDIHKPEIKITTNVKSKYSYDNKEGRFLILENVLFDEGVLEATLGSNFSDVEFMMKCRTKVMGSDTNKEKEMVMVMHDVMLKSYEIEVGHKNGSNKSDIQENVKIVFQIHGDDGELEILDKEVK